METTTASNIESIVAGSNHTPTIKRRRFTNSERMAMVRSVKRRVAAGESIRGACRSLNIIPKQYREWNATMKEISECRPQAKSICKGCPSQLDPIESDLLKFVFELREQGFAVSTSTIVVKASTLMREFREKSARAKEQVVMRWIKRHSFVYRMGTHESQRAPAETSSLSADYIARMQPKLAEPNRSQDFILNMDQTPIPFTFNAKKTLELVGERTVHIRKSTNDTKRVTCALTVSASGIVLTPMLVFKGSANGRISKNEFPTFPKEILYACQNNAWMDEAVMLVWVDQILKPYIATAPPGIVPILLLDSYRCHMMQSVVRAIEDLGCEVDHIPGGCTSLCQPVDVGVNKPLKTRMKQKWETWMIDELLQDGIVRSPTRRHIAEWCLHAYTNLPEQMVCNSWRHGPYSYFVHNHPEPAAGAEGAIEAHHVQEASPQHDEDETTAEAAEQGLDKNNEEDETTVGEEPEEVTPPGQPIFDEEDTEQDGTAPGGQPIFDEEDSEQDGTAAPGGQPIFDKDDTQQQDTILTFPSLPNTMSFIQKLGKHQEQEVKADDDDDEFDGNSSGDEEEPQNSEPLLSFHGVNCTREHQSQQHADFLPARITPLPRGVVEVSNKDDDSESYDVGSSDEHQNNSEALLSYHSCL